LLFTYPFYVFPLITDIGIEPLHHTPRDARNASLKSLDVSAGWNFLSRREQIEAFARAPEPRAQY
jgi:hypothetical protein